MAYDLPVADKQCHMIDVAMAMTVEDEIARAWIVGLGSTRDLCPGVALTVEPASVGVWGTCDEITPGDERGAVLLYRKVRWPDVLSDSLHAQSRLCVMDVTAVLVANVRRVHDLLPGPRRFAHLHAYLFEEGSAERINRRFERIEGVRADLTVDPEPLSALEFAHRRVHLLIKNWAER